MRPLNRVLALLPTARKSGNGWVATCPAHEDKRPSLSVCEGSDGRALVFCHAGCSAKAICSAMGIELNALFPRRAASKRRS